MIFDDETAQTILHALATGYVDRAASLAYEKADLPLEDREDLVARLLGASSVAEAARALGDWTRSHDGEAWLVNESYRTCFYRGDWWKRQAQSPMTRYFFGNKAGRPLDKWPHYFPIYERFLDKYVGSEARVLEIGVFRGGGLDLLADYLGPSVRLVGMDIDETARDLADPKFPVFLGDQSDPHDLLSLQEQHGPFDVIVDDGGHTVKQQVVSAETLFPLLRDGGVYLIEDVHTSYWSEYLDAGDDNLLDWARARLDDVNAHHFSREQDLNVWQRCLRAVHVFDSMVVLEKAESYPPFSELVGTKQFALPTRERESYDLELLATRDAAIAQRDALRAELDEVKTELARTVGSRSRRAVERLRRGLDKSS